MFTWKKFRSWRPSTPTFKRKEIVCMNVTRKRNEQNMYEKSVMASILESTFRARTTTLSRLLLYHSSLKSALCLSSTSFLGTWSSVSVVANGYLLDDSVNFWSV